MNDDPERGQMTEDEKRLRDRLRKGIRPGRPSHDAFWRAMNEVEERGRGHSSRLGFTAGLTAGAVLAVILLGTFLFAVRPHLLPAHTGPAGTPHSAAPMVTPTPSPSPTASGIVHPPSTSVPVAPLARCHTSGLSITLGKTGAAAGNDYTTFDLQNVSGQACETEGFPGMAMMAADGSQLPTNVLWQNGALASPGPTLVVLPAGGVAHFNIHWTDVPSGDETSCPTATTLLVTPPNETTQLRVAVNMAPCGNGTIDASPVRQGADPTGDPNS
ncbi:MAG TPA: DUF4232 domain-containing protein [Candidatus Dormibacteraeota bacterium]|jgi:hypothetical protein|nr:DUF4232 domain-containing protein [Candidatus Dormibacteraeota bacterium]